jgi:Ca2+-binding RTX toxin-like protein
MDSTRVCVSCDRLRHLGRPLVFGHPAAVVGLTVVLLASPSAAQAAFLDRSGSEVGYQAGLGETNHLEVKFFPGDATTGDPPATFFTDPGQTITTDPADPGCLSAGELAACLAEPGDTVAVDLRDGDDGVTVLSPFGAQLCGGPGDDNMVGGGGDDFILGESGIDTIDGGAGNELVITDFPGCDPTQAAPPAANVVNGGAGDDGLVGGSGRDTLTGGDGNDTLLGARVESGAAGDVRDELDGGNGDDWLAGYGGDDVLTGGTGADLLAGAGGDDQELGGEGSDQLGLTVNQASAVGTAPVQMDAGTDTLDGGPGDDTLNGGPGGMIMNFGLQGAIGAFETTAPNGPDDLIGGSGRDAVTYLNLALPVRATLDGSANDGSDGEGDNVRPDNEVLVGGSVSDALIGGAGGESLDGGRGGDSLFGAGGDDSLTGGADDGGADRLAGGAGRDALDGGPGDDGLLGEVDEDVLEGGGGTDTAEGGEGSDRVSGGAGTDTLSGGPGDDRILGAAVGLVGADGADSLRGDEGNDEINGGSSNDTLAGGRGGDVIAGGDGIDTADYSGALGPVKVTLNGLTGDGEAREGDHVRQDVESVRGGDEEDTFIGNEGPNQLTGGGGEDFVDGVGGSDGLDGGHGVDVVRARDRAADRVACGTSRDLAIVDQRDRVSGTCEAVDDGRRLRPALGRSMVVDPRTAAADMRLAFGRRFVPLKDSLVLPLGSSLDTTSGAVRVVTAPRRGAAAAQRRPRVQSGTFSNGMFEVRQRRRSGAPTVLQLQGRSFRGCRALGRKVIIRRLQGRGRGRFTTVGRVSSTLTRRGRWVVEDRCDGTLTRIQSGLGTVLDPRVRRRIVVRPGRSYLAGVR